MDSYDEVHDVKDGREITTPELVVSNSIRFVNNEDDEKEEFGGRNVTEEVSMTSHASNKFPRKLTFQISRFKRNQNWSD